MVNLLLGSTDVGPYSTGEASQKPYLTLLFSLAAFVIMIHLLNMLIAIMGNTYSNRSEIAEQLRYRDHLRFVLDNWYLKGAAFGGEIGKVKYIIAAFTTGDVDDECEVMEELEQQIQQVEINILDNHKKTALRMQ